MYKNEDPIMHQINQMLLFIRNDHVEDGLEEKVEARKRLRLRRRNAGRDNYRYNRIHILDRAADRRRDDPMFRLNSNVSKNMCHSLKGGKGGSHWEDLVGYTLLDLIMHLEPLFESGMTWENYGKWHVDHKKPISLFQFTKPSDPEFLECWALDNLQPLWAADNISKGNRWYG